MCRRGEGVPKYIIPREELYSLYIEKEETVEVIASHFGCSVAVVRRRLKEYGINKEGKYERIKIDEEELYRLYVIENLSVTACAKFFNCSPDVIKLRVKKQGMRKIPEPFTREDLYNEYVLNTRTTQECAEIFGVRRERIDYLVGVYGFRKSKEQFRKSLTRFKLSFNELYEHYVVQGKTAKEIGALFGCCTGTIEVKLRQYGITKRRTYKDIEENLLHELYVTQNLSSEEVGKRLGVSTSVIHRACHYYQIKKDRSLSYEISWETKRKNHTCNYSKPEERFFEYLCVKYGKSNVYRQYKEPRYPFFCDFYIKSLDIFVELNLFWTHGDSPFDAKNARHIEILNEWKIRAETSPHYVGAVETWSVRDPLKLKTAKNNNLKYIMYYKGDNLYDGRI